MEKRTLIALSVLAVVCSVIVWALIDAYAGQNLEQETVLFEWRGFKMYGYWIWFPLSFIIASAFLGIGYYIGTGCKDAKISLAIFLTGVLLWVACFEDFLYFMVVEGLSISFEKELTWMLPYAIFGTFTWRWMLVWMVIVLGVIALMWYRLLRET